MLCHSMFKPRQGNMRILPFMAIAVGCNDFDVVISRFGLQEMQTRNGVENALRRLVHASQVPCGIWITLKFKNV